VTVHRDLEAQRRLSMTYRKAFNAPMLVALDPMRGDPKPDELMFMVRAWSRGCLN
jgi:hypothetical protein